MQHFLSRLYILLQIYTTINFYLLSFIFAPYIYMLRSTQQKLFSCFMQQAYHRLCRVALLAYQHIAGIATTELRYQSSTSSLPTPALPTVSLSRMANDARSRIRLIVGLLCNAVWCKLQLAVLAAGKTHWHRDVFVDDERLSVCLIAQKPLGETGVCRPHCVGLIDEHCIIFCLA